MGDAVVGVVGVVGDAVVGVVGVVGDAVVVDEVLVGQTQQHLYSHSEDPTSQLAVNTQSTIPPLHCGLTGLPLLVIHFSTQPVVPIGSAGSPPGAKKNDCTCNCCGASKEQLNKLGSKCDP